MKLNEYLISNGVKLFIYSKGEPRQTNNLGAYDYAENLDNVLGKHVWICDYRVNYNAVLKPIREVKPMEVVIADAKTCKKNIYYSPVYFQPVKGKKVLSTVIAPVDNTGFRCRSGVSVNIFDTKEECVKCYREQVRQANEIYEKEKARIIKEFDARMQILDDSLTPFNGIPQSDYAVTIKAQVTNNELPYSAKDRDYHYEVSESMMPEKYAIEKFKSRVLRGLADELRANTKWLRGAPISLTLFQHVYVDGLEDITQAEMMPLTLTL